MARFCFLTLVFVVVSGAILHLGIEVPYITPWMGSLPGDLTIYKGKTVLYIPLVSSLAATLTLLFLGSFFKSSKE